MFKLILLLIRRKNVRLMTECWLICSSVVTRKLTRTSTKCEATYEREPIYSFNNLLFYVDKYNPLKCLKMRFAQLDLVMSV